MQYKSKKSKTCLIRRIEKHKKGLGTDEYKSRIPQIMVNVEILNKVISDKKFLLKKCCKSANLIQH